MAVKLKAAHFPPAPVVEIADDKICVIEPKQAHSALGSEGGDFSRGAEILRALHSVLALPGFIAWPVDQPGEIDGRAMLGAELVNPDACRTDEVSPIPVVLVFWGAVFLPVSESRTAAEDNIFLGGIVPLSGRRAGKGAETQKK